MPTCAAFNCSRVDSKEERLKGFTFHRFPHNRPEVIKQWLINMKRDNFRPSKRALLCSAHFEKKCFKTNTNIVQLVENAVPTLFTFPVHLEKKTQIPRKDPAKRALTTVTDTPSEAAQPDVCQQPQPSTSTAIDHCYSLESQSPRKMKRRLEESLEVIDTMTKKLKTTHQKNRRLKRRVNDLSEIVYTLQDKNFISNNCADVLEKFSGTPKHLFQRALDASRQPGRKEYSPELRSFAMTLNFYSTKAYNFVRKTFNLALPHPSVIRSWYSSTPASPGFTELVFSALKKRAEKAAESGKKLLCSLMLDEMAIMKHIQWDGQQFHGYVSVGNDLYDDTTPVAKDALVIMAVAVNDNWKAPCGYFLIDGMSGRERANLINNCLQRLHEAGAQVVSLTCDGPSCHFSMLRELGANVTDPHDMKPYFTHPSDPSQRVYVMLDACHMLKLTRNALGDLKTLKDKDGKLICWSQIEALHTLQKAEGLLLANKLKSTHIDWRKQKMKVNLAAQTLSSSVADAIEFCSKELKLPPFLEYQGTVSFIRVFDKLFDILNSRHPFAKGSKSPLRLSNVDFWGPFLSEAEEYILGLQDSTGTPMTKSRRKTAFIGFLTCIHSARGLFQSLVASANAPLKYLLTYKMSQDHLELFFCALRSFGRGNNNPTAQQFTAAYKRLMMRHNIEATGGNCSVLEDTRILDAASNVTNTCEAGQVDATLADIARAKRYGLLSPSDLDSDDQEPVDLDSIPNPFTTLAVNEYGTAVIAYVAGFVCRMVNKKIRCPECIQALCADDGKCHKFIALKDRGGLKKPSDSVVNICQVTEKCIRHILHTTQNKLPQGPRIAHLIASSVLADVNQKVFCGLDEHTLTNAIEDNHVHRLIKTISLCFCKVRFHHLAKEHTEKLHGTKIRKTHAKLVLFSHQ